MDRKLFLGCTFTLHRAIRDSKFKIRNCLLCAFAYLLPLIAEAQTPATPGGVNNPAIRPIAWFTPENYSNGVWINRITTAGTVGNFTQPWTNKTPPATTTGNFHPAIMFRPAETTSAGAPHRMMSENMIGITNDEAFTIIMVVKNTKQLDYSGRDVLNYSVAGNYDQAYNVSYYSNLTDIPSTSWGPSSDAPRRALSAVPTGTMQLLTIDNSNTNSTLTKGMRWYIGGEKKTIMSESATNILKNNSANTQNGNDYKIVIGGSHSDLTGNGSHSFYGDVQELIILKRDTLTNPLMETNMQTELDKIHSSLAIKYGITLTSSNYIASNGTTVWDRAATAYNNHIFGIARDDNAGLYQKQSQSITSSFLTAFVGNDFAVLNSNNIYGKLDNGVYAMFGSNNGSFHETVSLAEITVPGFPSVNYLKKLVYKAQLTSASPQKIKLKISTTGGTLPEYVLVSTSATFPASTQVFPVNGSFAEVEIPVGASYIGFGGHKTVAGEGPGGVSSGLKLWLRADDASSIITVQWNLGESIIAGYPEASSVTTGSVPAVAYWSDPVRGQTYSYEDGGLDIVRHLAPVYQPSNEMTNYHPALRFWANGVEGTGLTSDKGDATWLANSKGVWTSQFPTDKKHSAFFVINNTFSAYEWAYTMMFDNTVPDDFKGPGYGVDKNGSNVVGRLRTDATLAYNERYAGTRGLFSFGATSILGYHVENTDIKSGSDVNVLWRFNGLEDSDGDKIENGNFSLNQPSIIGGGYKPNRTIQGVISEVIMYDGALTNDNLQKIESYLALKYGVTLTPSPGVYDVRKFDYKFPDNTMLWPGATGEAKWQTYYNRIAAVIRDDGSNLHNRQSHSTNVGSILHMGVAGTRLGSNADPGNFEYDKEAVIWGDNGLTGEQSVSSENSGKCGDFTNIFNRIWLVHKITKDDRPVDMLVGAQNNAGNQLGKDADNGTKQMFSRLTEYNEVYMLVADSPEKLTPGSAKIVPMEFLDGEQQCRYTFDKDTTYITFGYRIKDLTCAETVQFEGTKTFYWTQQWPRKSYSASDMHSGVSKPAFDLGDGVTVGTTVQYASNVNTVSNYPSGTNSPAAGSLYLKRRNGVSGNDKATVTINMNTPVRPEFSIFDIDGYAGQLEQITITGYCNSGVIVPTLSYGSTPATSYYKISGSTATATKKSNLSASNSKGRLNVSFAEGVTKIVIEFAITGKQSGSTAHNLIISPIRFRQVPPPPPISEGGLAFTKDVVEREISTCEPVEYTFYIHNTNCEPKYVNFRDTLPSGMKWTGEIGMGAIQELDDSKLDFNDYEGTGILEIDSLYVPGADVLKVTATAIIEDGAVDAENTEPFDNHAWIKYKYILQGADVEHTLHSVDRETPTEKETRFNAVGATRLDTVKTEVTADVSSYIADGLVTVTVKVNNPNSTTVPGSYLDVDFDAGFTYVANSFEASTNVTPTPVIVTGGDAGGISIAGATNGETGFIIPLGESSYTFKLKAPAHAGLAKDEDDGHILPLKFDYAFSSEAGDPCVITSMADMSGTLEIPYNTLTANDDYASTTTGVKVAVPVQLNDIIPSDCTAQIGIEVIPERGDAELSAGGDSIIYTPVAAFYGVDSFTYSIKCGLDVREAKVYVIVLKPLALKYVACEDKDASLTMGFTAISGVTYNWYTQKEDGTSIKTGETYQAIKNSDPVQTWWVEATYRGVKLPRYQVDLELGDCGVTDPQGCAVTGTVLFKEDFGGNSESDPPYKQPYEPKKGIPQMDHSIYKYNITPTPITTNYNKAPYLDESDYMIAKIGEPHSYSESSLTWDTIYDHTYPLTGSRGYFLEVNASEKKGQFYEHTINGLCEGTTLYFSAWINNVLRSDSYGDDVNQVFVLEDGYGVRIAEYYTGDIKNGNVGWKQYGFLFTVPANVSTLKLRIINNGTGSSGNDFALDDIEIRFCAPPVTITLPEKTDTAVCLGSSFNFAGEYTDDNNTFGSELVCRWEKNTGETNDPDDWEEIDGTHKPSNSGTVSSTYTITTVTLEDEGYYRMVVANAANIENYNCRAMSDIVHVRVSAAVISGTVSSDQSICYGKTPDELISTQASGGTAPHTFQWQQSTDDGSTWQNVSVGGTASNYTPSALTQTTQYRLITKGGTLPCETATSNTVTVTLSSSVPASDIVIAGKTDVCYGMETTLTASVSGVTNPVFRWYKSQTDTEPFHTGSVYTTSLLTADTSFYLSVSGDGYCESLAGERKEVNIAIQDPNTQGTDFYVSFGQNYNRPSQEGPITLQVRIAAQKTTKVTLTFNEGTLPDVTFNVSAGSIHTHDLTEAQKNAVYSNVTGTSNKSLRIQSDELVSVYALNRSMNTTDATFVLPVDVLGTDYYQISYMPSASPFMDGYTIVAVKDDTEISENGAHKVTLNSGQVYSYYNPDDMTGYHITSSKPVAYFVTNQMAMVPHSIGDRDHLYEQMLPVSTWGKTYAVPVTVRGVERVRIVASQNGTVITQDGGEIITGSLTLNSGEFVELEIKLAKRGCYISADKPVGVASYLTGMYYDELTYGHKSVGDPSLTIVPPIEQMVGSAYIAPFYPSVATNLSDHRVMIITPTSKRLETTVTIGNGAPTSLSGGSWVAVSGSGSDYSFYTMPLTNMNSTYYFSNPNRLLVMGFGLGASESYGYLSGAAVRTLEASFYVDGNHYLDLDGKTICVGSEVSFMASGVNPASGASGYLKWYINDVEETTHEDELQWTKSLANGTYTVRTDVTDRCRTYSFTTTFNVVNRALADDITVKDTAVCSGTAATLTPVSIVPDPVFYWYKSQTEESPFYTGASYTTSSLTEDTVLYVSVSGTDYCENEQGKRKEVTVRIQDYATADMITVDGIKELCPNEYTVLTASAPGVTEPVYRWYKSLTATEPFHTGEVYTTSVLTADTTFYLSVSGKNYCENEADKRKAVEVKLNAACPLADDATASCNDGQIFINVLVNDNVLCASPEVNIVTLPKNGTATVGADNRIEYTVRYSGLDSLEYNISCDNFSSATAWVYITVDASASAFTDNVWYFGRKNGEGKSPGIRFVYDGTNYVPQDASGESMVDVDQNALVVSAPYCEGQVLFYASDKTLYNSQHQQIGTFDGHQQAADGLAACYMKDNKYLFFSITNSHLSGNRALKAYTVDMNADYGRGARTAFDTIIEPVNDNMSEGIELIPCAGTSNQYWLVYHYCSSSCGTNMHLTNEVRVRKVDVSNPEHPSVGAVLHTAPKVNPVNGGATGSHMVKVSRQYNRIAIQDIDYLRVYLYDFDNSTGKIEHLYNIGDGSYSRMLLGVEFSPDGNQLYFSHHGTGTGTLIPNLYQYDISGPAPLKNEGSPVKYWTQTIDNQYKGGGLKMGPDGKMYVTLCSDNQIGVISDPNSKSSLEDRYNNTTAFNLNITAAYSFNFSTGLTKPGLIPCNTNVPPTAQADAVDMCVSATSRTVKVNVLKDDTDADGDVIFLTGAQFVNPADAALATLTVNPADSTVTLTVREGAVIPPEGRVFNIIYSLKDDGLPASACSSGTLKITARNRILASDIRIEGETALCYNTATTLTASTDLSVSGLEFRWYKSPTDASPFHTGASYTTSSLKEDTVLYVSVWGTDHCENEANDRKEVKVTVNPLCAHDEHFTVTCTTPEEIDALLNDSISDDCKSSLELSIIEEPKHGDAKVEGTGINAKIVYTYTGVELAVHDSLEYKISCGQNLSSTAKVYFTISHVGSAFVDDVWYFGKNSQGIRFVNGSSGYEAQDASGESKVQSHENSLVVSSPYCDGQNIFYSSHDQLYNSLHQPMQHGHFEGHESVADGLAACYMGANRYLFFSVTNAYESGNRGLNAYVVDMTVDNGRGDIVGSTIQIESPTAYMSESIELIAGNTPNKYWLVYAYKTGTHHELRVREVDVSYPLVPVVGSSIVSSIQTSTTYSYNTYTLKASQQHDRLAIANSDDRTADVFDFNNTTGHISKLRTTPSEHKIDGLAYGVEFSPDGSQLYVAGYTTFGGTPMLCQYTIGQSNLTYVSSIKYWTYTGSDGSSRGGGLKLGPDGNIYVMQCYVPHLGVVTDPNDITPLSERYQFNGIDFKVEVNSYAEQFSTGLTKPATIVCNMNNAPETKSDSAKLCIGSASRSVGADVLENDTDFENNNLYVTEAHFDNITDTVLARLAISATADSVILTLKPGAEIPSGGHVFYITYSIKDDGIPASQCATGSLKVETYSPPTYPDIRIRICPDAGDVNLSRYLDTANGVKISSIVWKSLTPGISFDSPAGKLSSYDLKSARVYTFTYTLSDLCGTSPLRKVYLEKLEPERMRPLKDTVVMCYKYADAVQVNQLFGLEANGTWSYFSSNAGDVDEYVKKSTSATYEGAVVMNGKAIYEKAVAEDDLDDYHGNKAKTVTFTYEADPAGCLKGTTYIMTIVLTEDIVN